VTGTTVLPPADSTLARDCIEVVDLDVEQDLVAVLGFTDGPRDSRLRIGVDRAILDRLRQGPRPVGEIAQGMPVGRPAVSQHLKVLKDAGLVSDQAVGTRRLYQIDRDGFEIAQQYLGSFWSDALARFKRIADSS
jgi:DNA-binding transcriptional ArsR family regulator